MSLLALASSAARLSNQALRTGALNNGLIGTQRLFSTDESVKQEVAAQFSKWNSALATLDPSKVASCYAPDGVLLPTVSNKVRRTKEEIVDYFQQFLKLRPQGKIDQANVRILSPNSAINSGVYTFDLVKDGQPTKVQARYSFTYRKIGNDWYIADHHSSAMPEKV
mmetsp:Transcript_1748/g.3874  ORF Transcript_1748/g.3874 Transcript_1748/m.3874 type:complete len:166 (-) Transcript_1748:417-914(-)